MTEDTKNEIREHVKLAVAGSAANHGTDWAQSAMQTLSYLVNAEKTGDERWWKLVETWARRTALLRIDAKQFNHNAAIVARSRAKSGAI